MKKKGWDIGLLLVILLISTVGIRLYYVNSLMVDVVVNENIYNQMRINDGNGVFGVLSSIFRAGFNFETIYLAALYLAYLVFGNLMVAGIYLNVLFQTLTIIIVFTFIYIVTRKYITFRLSMLISVFPAYIQKISVVSSFNMISFFSATVVFIFAMIVRSVYIKLINKTNTVIEAQKPKESLITVSSIYNDASMREIRADDLEDNRVKLLDNPLPLPKRRKHREMEFAIALTPENDDFDIKNIPENDDFDI